MKPLILALGILFIFGLTGCATVYNPVTAKNELIFIGTQAEVDLGKNITKQISQERKVIKSGGQKDRIESIGKKVAYQSDRKDLEYNFFLIKDKELNAFAVPGGFVYIHSGLADIATDDELACVIGHEIVHIAARHSIKQLQAALGYQLLISVALGAENQETARRISDMVFNLSRLGYSRSDENLADKIGIKYAYLAGYKPEAMISFFNKLKEESVKQGGSLPIEIFSSHPDLDKRISLVKEEIKRLESFGKNSN
jgi:predicted Zn-dependent protease